MNEQIMRAAGLGDRVDLVKAGKRPFCKADTHRDDFQDEASYNEWRISGMCRKCQDGFFEGGDHD